MFFPTSALYKSTVCPGCFPATSGQRSGGCIGSHMPYLAEDIVTATIAWLQEIFEGPYLWRYM